MRLQKLDITIGEGLNVESDVVVEGPLIFNVKLKSSLCDNLVNLCVAWRGKDAIFHMDNEDNFAFVEHTVFHIWFQSNFL